MHEKYFDLRLADQGVSVGYKSHDDREAENVLASHNREWQVRGLQLRKWSENKDAGWLARMSNVTGAAVISSVAGGRFSGPIAASRWSPVSCEGRQPCLNARLPLRSAVQQSHRPKKPSADCEAPASCSAFDTP